MQSAIFNLQQTVPGLYRHQPLYKVSHYFHNRRADHMEDSCVKIFLCYFSSYVFVLCCFIIPQSNSFTLLHFTLLQWLVPHFTWSAQLVRMLLLYLSNQLDWQHQMEFPFLSCTLRSWKIIALPLFLHKSS